MQAALAGQFCHCGTAFERMATFCYLIEGYRFWLIVAEAFRAGAWMGSPRWRASDHANAGPYTSDRGGPVAPGLRHPHFTFEILPARVAKFKASLGVCFAVPRTFGPA